jgi:hypothetical protein
MKIRRKYYNHQFSKQKQLDSFSGANCSFVENGPKDEHILT